MFCLFETPYASIKAKIAGWFVLTCNIEPGWQNWGLGRPAQTFCFKYHLVILLTPLYYDIVAKYRRMVMKLWICGNESLCEEYCAVHQYKSYEVRRTVKSSKYESIRGALNLIRVYSLAITIKVKIMNSGGQGHTTY